MGISPPKIWRVPVITVLGIMVGLGIFILRESKVVSYMGDDPKTCINCHVMTAEYVTWDHSSHGEVTTCNDCHVPHDNALRKYAFKAKDGLYHATIFTLHAEPEAIVMHEAGQKVVQQNCVRCHSRQVTDAKLASWISNHFANRTERTCWACHREVPHGRVRSLSSVGYMVEPLPDRVQQDKIVPEWIKKSDNQTKE